MTSTPCPLPDCDGTVTTRYYATGPGHDDGERLPYTVCSNEECPSNAA